MFAGLGVTPAGVIKGADSAAAAMVAGVFLGSALWWLILSSVIGRLRHYIGARILTLINRVSGTVLTAFGLYAMASLVPRASLQPVRRGRARPRRLMPRFSSRRSLFEVVASSAPSPDSTACSRCRNTPSAPARKAFCAVSIWRARRGARQEGTGHLGPQFHQRRITHQPESPLPGSTACLRRCNWHPRPLNGYPAHMSMRGLRFRPAALAALLLAGRPRVRAGDATTDYTAVRVQFLQAMAPGAATAAPMPTMIRRCAPIRCIPTCRPNASARP